MNQKNQKIQDFYHNINKFGKSTYHENKSEYTRNKKNIQQSSPPFQHLLNDASIIQPNSQNIPNLYRNSNEIYQHSSTSFNQNNYKPPDNNTFINLHSNPHLNNIHHHNKYIDPNFLNSQYFQHSNQTNKNNKDTNNERLSKLGNLPTHSAFPIQKNKNISFNIPLNTRLNQ